MSDHCQRYPFCNVTYWKGNSASLAAEDWTVCKVTPLGMYTSGEQIFDNSEGGIYARDKLLRFLEKAYDLGYSHAKRDIREVLGVKEPRS